MPALNTIHQFSPFVSTLFPSAKNIEYTLVTNESGGEEEISICHDQQQVIWSRGGFLYKKFTLKNIQQVITCTFQQLPGRCLCVLIDECVMIYSTEGSYFRVALPCKVERMYALPKHGFMIRRKISPSESDPLSPILLSLSHPLEEWKPVCKLKGDTAEYFNDKYENLVHVDTRFGICVTYKENKHFVYEIEHCPVLPKLDSQLDAEYFIKPIKMDTSQMDGTCASTVLFYRDLTDKIMMGIFKKDVQSFYGYDLNDKICKYSISNIKNIAIVKCVLDFEMCLVLDTVGNLVLLSGQHRVCQYNCNLKILDISDAMDHFVNIHTQNGVFRVYLQGISSSLLKSVFNVLHAILPTEVFVNLLRDVLEYDSSEQWNAFTHIMYQLIGREAEKKNLYSKPFFQKYTSRVIFGLHLLYENCKLNVLSFEMLRPVADLLSNMTSYLNWAYYTDYYLRDFEDLNVQVPEKQELNIKIIGNAKMKHVKPYQDGRMVPSIYRFLYSKLKNSPVNPFPNIECKAMELLEKFTSIKSFTGAHLIPFLEGLNLNTLPFGISCIFKECMSTIRENPPSNFSKESYELIDRQDLSNLYNNIARDDQVLNHIFPNDKRLEQIYRMLDSSKPIAMTQELTEPQDQQKWLLVQSNKILAQCIGRGMFALGRNTIQSTDLLRVPPIVLAAETKRNKALIKLDMSQLPQNATFWPEFHNGVATATSIQLADTGPTITREWILYHRPETPTNEHAGLILGLGLIGHLKQLRSTDVFSLLSIRHDPTTIATLIGVAASKIGSQDSQITKSLSLHIASLVPGTDLEMSNEIQSAALLGIGLLYHQSAHRFMTEVLLDELARPPDDRCTDRESYSLAAGIALGLVNLAKGTKHSSPPALADMRIEEKLYRYMVGGKRPATDPYYKRRETCMKILEPEKFVNVDVTGPGATLALAFMFLQTNNRSVANRIALPDTRYLLEYVRPDMIMLRLLSYYLVMWDEIKATNDWIMGNIPPMIMQQEDEIMQDIYVHIIAASCLVLGIKFAGTNRKDVKDLLIRHLSTFEQSKKNCGLACVLALSCVVAGSGDVEIVKIIKKYSKIFEDSYGAQMALSMALGLSFLGSGRFSLSTTPTAVAALVCSLYPRFPFDFNDNKYHLQCLRHFYILACENRLLETRDVDSNEICNVPIKVKLKDAEMEFKTPCLLPEIRNIEQVSISNDRYYPIILDVKNDLHLNALKRGLIYVKKRAGYLSYDVDPKGIRNIKYQSPKIPLDSSTNIVNLFGAFDGHVQSFANYFCTSDKEDVSYTSALYDALSKDSTDLIYIYQMIRQGLMQLTNTDVWNIKLILTFYENIENPFLLSKEYLESVKSELASKMKMDQVFLAKYLTRNAIQNGLGVLLEYNNIPNPRWIQEQIVKLVQTKSDLKNYPPNMFMPYLLILMPNTPPQILKMLCNHINFKSIQI